MGCFLLSFSLMVFASFSFIVFRPIFLASCVALEIFDLANVPARFSRFFLSYFFFYCA